jgi:uncharacterized protein YjdB
MQRSFRSKISVLLIAIGLVIAAVGFSSITSSAATAPKSLTLNIAKTTTVGVGEKIQLSVKSVSPQKASKSVTWSSSDKTYASVNANGVVTAKKAGKTVTITATSIVKKSVKVKVKIKVVKAPTKLTLNTTKETIGAGETLQLSAKVAPSNASQNVTWKSSNEKYATVSSTGKVTAKKAGSVTITVTSNSNSKVKATAKVTVLAAPTKLTLNKTKATLVVGDTVSLSVKGTTPAGASERVTWKSSNTKCATVTNAGKVTAKKAGSVTITATSKSNKVKATAKITIYAKTTELTLNQKSAYIYGTNGSMKIKATTNANATPVAWSSSNTKAVTVKASSDGKTATLTYKDAGIARITAKSGSKEKTITIIVYKGTRKTTSTSTTFTIPNVADKLRFTSAKTGEQNIAHLGTITKDVKTTYDTLMNGGSKATVEFFGYKAVITPSSATAGTVKVTSSSTEGLDQGQYTYSYTVNKSKKIATLKGAGLTFTLQLKGESNLKLYLGTSATESKLLASFVKGTSNTVITVGSTAPQYEDTKGYELYYTK